MGLSITNGIQVNDPGNGLYEDFVRDKNIKPHERQEHVLQLPDDIFECLYGGAAYGGKSWLLTLLPLFRGFYKYRGFKGIILRRKFPDLEREIIRLSKEYYPLTGGKYNETKHSWEWPMYGSYMDFGHVQHDSDIKMYDSAQYNYAGFDELTHFTPHPYHYMVGSRIRPGGDFHIAFVRNGTNPGGPGQQFVYDRFVKPAQEGYKVIRDRATTLTRIFIPALATDNPYGMEHDPLYVKKLEILKQSSEAEYKAKRWGDWHAFKGSVFTSFRPIHFPGEPENALHVVKPFIIPEWWPRILAIDWGKTAMCYAMWGAISPDKRVYVYRERPWKGKDIAIWASEIRELHIYGNEEPLHTVLCGSAWQSRGSETIASEFQKYSGLIPNSSINAPGTRVPGLQLIHEFLRWEKKNLIKAKGEIYDLALAQKIYRLHGPEALERYRRLFMDEQDETNLPVLQIFDNCTTLIDTIPMAVYDEKKTEDIAEFDGDDPLDCLRYFCKGSRQYLDGEIGNPVKQQQIEAMAKAYEEAQDMNDFYRRAEFLEKRNNVVTAGQQFKRKSGLLSRRRR